MNVTIEAGPLAGAFKTVLPAAGGHLPVIAGGVRITFDGHGALRLQCTDLDRTVDVRLDAGGDQPGTVVVPVRLVHRFVTSLPKTATVVLSAGGERFNVEAGDARLATRLIPVDDWPRLVPVAAEPVDASAWWPAARRVAHAAGTDHARPILTGLHFEDDAVVATDSYRMAAWMEPTGLAGLVPASIVASVPAGPVRMAVDGHQAAVTAGDTTWTSRMLGGEYPKWRGLVPVDCPHRVTVDREALAAAVNRCSLFEIRSKEGVARLIRLTVDGGKLRVEASDTDVGDTVDHVPCDGTLPGRLGLNADFLLDMLASLTEATVTFEATDLNKPLVFREPPYIGVLMPVRMAS